MAVAARVSEERYAPVTVVYRHSKAAVAQPVPQPKTRPRTRPVAAPQTKTRLRRVKDPKLKQKVVTIGSIVFVAFLAIVMLSGYIMVYSTSSQINQMKAQNVELEASLNELNAQLEQSVDLNEIRQAALSEGMIYPDSQQIVPIG